MNITNIVGQKTQAYINKNKFNGETKMPTTKTTTTNVETPVNHFKRIANARLHRAIYAIELLGNCVGAGYEHTTAQENTIETKVLETLQLTLNNLQNPKEKKAETKKMLL